MGSADPIRVLFIVGEMEIGGVQSGIMNFVRITPPEQVHFDVLVLTEKVGYHEAEFRKYGNVYHMPLLHAKGKLMSIPYTILNDLIFNKKFSAFLKSHDPYDSVHTKLLKGAAPAMEAARNCNVPVRVVQSHVDRPERLNPFDTWYYKWCAKRIEKSATVKLAVSEKAGELLFDSFSTRIIKNPTVDLSRLDPSKYPQKLHSEIRLIQIGTYSYRKNQCFSLDVLKALLDQGCPAHLTFIGYPLDNDSAYLRKTEAKVHDLGLEKNVAFLPGNSDVPRLLSESDYMLIPSLREGLPNVALEAQAMGVPCFLSDTITKTVNCGLCSFLSLQDRPEIWADKILRYRKEKGADKNFVDMSSWDNRKIVEDYFRIWNGEKYSEYLVGSKREEKIK